MKEAQMWTPSSVETGGGAAACWMVNAVTAAALVPDTRKRRRSPHDLS